MSCRSVSFHLPYHTVHSCWWPVQLASRSFSFPKFAQHLLGEGTQPSTCFSWDSFLGPLAPTWDLLAMVSLLELETLALRFCPVIPCPTLPPSSSEHHALTVLELAGPLCVCALSSAHSFCTPWLFSAPRTRMVQPGSSLFLLWHGNPQIFPFCKSEWHLPYSFSLSRYLILCEFS